MNPNNGGAARTNKATNRDSITSENMPNFITLRIPIWFPCFLSTLLAFAGSIKPALTLPTLPAESGLNGIPPWLAILSFTALGFAWGLVLSWALAKQVAGNNTAHNRPT